MPRNTHKHDSKYRNFPSFSQIVDALIAELQLLPQECLRLRFRLCAELKLLTTSVARTGKPPRWPMPRFYMTRSDAEAVVAYLKSIDVKH